MSRLLSFVALLLTVLVGLGPLDAAAKSQPRIAVLELSGPLKAQELALMSDQIRAGVLTGLQGKPYVVMSRENMAAIAKDMNVDLSCVEGQCEVDTARNLGATWVVSASLVQMGGTWLCTVKVHDVGTGGLKASGKVDGSEAIHLVDQLPSLAERLVIAAFGSEPIISAEREIAAVLAAERRRIEEEARQKAAQEAGRVRLAEEESRRKAVEDAERQRLAEEETRLRAVQDADAAIKDIWHKKKAVEQPRPPVEHPDRSGVMGSTLLGSLGLSVGSYRYKQEALVTDGALSNEDIVVDGGENGSTAAIGIDAIGRYVPGIWGVELKYSGSLSPAEATLVTDEFNDSFPLSTWEGTVTGIVRWDRPGVRPALRLGAGMSSITIVRQTVTDGDSSEDPIAEDSMPSVSRVLEYESLVVPGVTAGAELESPLLGPLSGRVWLDFFLGRGSKYIENSLGMEVAAPIKTSFFVSAGIKMRNRETSVYVTPDGPVTKREVGVLEDHLYCVAVSVGYMR
jgi:hypothetical protein